MIAGDSKLGRGVLESLKKVEMAKSSKMPEVRDIPLVTPDEESEIRGQAAYFAAKEAFIFDRIFKKVESSQGEKYHKMRKIGYTAWHRVASNFMKLSNTKLIFDECMTRAATFILEKETTFAFGESEFEKICLTFLPSAASLDQCEFRAEHLDFDNIHCVKVKLMSSDLGQILATIDSFNSDFCKVASFFSIKAQQFAKGQTGPSFLRVFSFFTKSS